MFEGLFRMFPTETGVGYWVLTSEDPVADLLAPVLVSVLGEHRTGIQHQGPVLWIRTITAGPTESRASLASLVESRRILRVSEPRKSNN